MVADCSKLLQGIRSGSYWALSKAITLIESQRAEDVNLSRKLLLELQQSHHANIRHTKHKPPLRIGFSGPPGSGKSTFISRLGLHIASQPCRNRVGVLTVDPSSPVHGGSILGDITRMSLLSAHPNAFVRASPSCGIMGGVAPGTRDVLRLCEYAGLEVLLIETVGVGQGEYEVFDMVDLMVLLVNPSGGDEIQAAKKGVLELTDMVIVNKADLNHQAALHTKRIYEDGLSSKYSYQFYSNHFEMLKGSRFPVYMVTSHTNLSELEPSTTILTSTGRDSKVAREYASDSEADVMSPSIADEELEYCSDSSKIFSPELLWPCIRSLARYSQLDESRNSIKQIRRSHLFWAELESEISRRLKAQPKIRELENLAKHDSVPLYEAVDRALSLLRLPVPESEGK